MKAEFPEIFFLTAVKNVLSLRIRILLPRDSLLIFGASMTWWGKGKWRCNSHLCYCGRTPCRGYEVLVCS